MVVRGRADVKYPARWDGCHESAPRPRQTIHGLTTDGMGKMIGKLLLHTDSLVELWMKDEWGTGRRAKE